MKARNAGFAATFLVGTLTLGAAIPGCCISGPVAGILYELLIGIAVNVASSEIGHFVEAKLDSWVFHKTDTENKGGDVVVDPSDPLVGRYNGTLRITIQNDRVGRSFPIDLFQPKMRRLSTSPAAPWVLDDNDDVQKVMKRAEESAR